MPRDLQSERTIGAMPELTKEPEHMATTTPEAMIYPEDAAASSDGAGGGGGGGGAAGIEADNDGGDRLMRDMAAEDARSALHPYAQTLTLSDLESCVRLEEACFPAHEAASRDKFVYRLKHSSPLCLGLFTSTPATAAHSTDVSAAATAPAARPVDSARPARHTVLLAHIVATQTDNPVVRDEDMAIPARYMAGASDAERRAAAERDRDHDAHDARARPRRVGNVDGGPTVALHSLAVLPEHQRKGLGRTLLRSYVQRLEAAEVADRVALLAREPLVPFYEGLGFRNLGRSESAYAGGGWFDMVLDIKKKGAPTSP
ncbi:hypothetical protein BDY21DRAFT_375311 [Lineolata rhizophorae]|uniref:N-acetyltransferase domain-containing protein n=1 Tax=Lineolata rhizophorae TaxID=578093 RepID=A0A6A6NLY4_9PEZI|nr:hypothetical protein BDY21DRAFT_375311 [Lineolata rhizophorae]